MTTTAPLQSKRVASILEAACRVIVRDGAHGLRMASVAGEAGVSKALVHYYFSTRQELLRSALVFAEERREQAISSELADLATGRERLERVLLATLDAQSPFREQRALWNEVWSTLRFDDDLRPVVDRYYRAWLDHVVQLVRDGQADGSISSEIDARDTGWCLAAAADGFDSMRYLDLVDTKIAGALIRQTIVRELAAP
jgi:AcrR family transcriptional regulator